MTNEYLALLRNNTWRLVDLPSDRKPSGCKWMFKLKENPDGSIYKHKARLVAQGFHQVAGFDFSETFSPAAKPATIRILLSIAINTNWKIHQVDVNNAFLKDDLKEEVYMTQPFGFEDHNHPTAVRRLIMSIYGLKQAPRAWFEKLQTTLISQGFKNAITDHSLFVLHTPTLQIFILVYIDDILITGNSEVATQSLIQKLNMQFSLKDLGEINYFLGVEVQ